MDILSFYPTLVLARKPALWAKYLNIYISKTQLDTPLTQNIQHNIFTFKKYYLLLQNNNIISKVQFSHLVTSNLHEQIYLKFPFT
jgi:hypothetical protein